MKSYRQRIVDLEQRVEELAKRPAVDEKLERRVAKLEKATVNEKRVASLEKVFRMVKNIWAAAVLAEDNQTSPPPNPSIPITVTELGETTLYGRPIWKLESDDTDWLEISYSSGGVSAFSADGMYLAVKKYQQGTHNGKWYALRVTDKELIELGDINSGGINENLIWAASGSQYFLIRSGVLERRTIDGTVVASRALQSTISHYAAGSVTPQYRLQVGAQRNNPALTIIHYDEGVYDDNGIMRFNPTTLEFQPHWWTKTAFDAGSAAGTALAGPTKITNLVTFGAGYAGKPNTTTSLPNPNDASDFNHWVPADGSTAVEIENLQFPGPVEPAGSSQSHPAYRVKSDGSVFEVVGRNASNELDGNIWSYPPTVNQGNRVRQWTLDKAEVASMFDNAPTNQFGTSHADVGIDYAIATLRNWSFYGTEDHREGLVKVRTSDGAVWPIYAGLRKRPGSAFNTSARPSICCQGSHAACMNQRGVDQQVDVLLFDLATPGEHRAQLIAMMNSAEFETQRQAMIAGASDYEATQQFGPLQQAYYAQPIYSEAEVNTAETLEDNSYYDRLFETWQALVDAHNITVPVDSGIGSSGWNGDNGYSNPQTARGASKSSYLAVQNVPFLTMMEWAMAVIDANIVIQQSTVATTSQKAAADTFVDFVVENVAERYLVSSTWNETTYYCDQAAANLNNASSPRHWQDHWMIAAVIVANIRQQYPIWGKTLPAFMNTPEPHSSGSGRPRMDAERWYSRLIKANPGALNMYGNPMNYGMEITGDGYAWLPPNPTFDGTSSDISDTFHAARVTHLVVTMERYGQFYDAATAARHEAIHQGIYDAIPGGIVYQDGSCWKVTNRSNGTEDHFDSNGDKLVWHWGALAMGNATIRQHYAHVIDAINLSSGDPCYQGGYDARNEANILSWVARAEKQ